MSSKPESFVLLCAGQSKKMASYGPRSLLRVKSDLLISKQINTIRSVYKRADIICVLGYYSEKVYKEIKDYGVKCVYNDSFKDTSSLKSMIYGIRLANQKVFVIHGDINLREENLNFDLKYNTALVDYSTSKDITVNLQGDNIIQFGYGFGVSWQKIIYFNTATTKLIKNFVMSESDVKRIDFELFNYLIDKDVQIKFFESKTEEINTLKSYKCVL